MLIKTIICAHFRQTPIWAFFLIANESEPAKRAIAEKIKNEIAINIPPKI